MLYDFILALNLYLFIPVIRLLSCSVVENVNHKLMVDIVIESNIENWLDIFLYLSTGQQRTITLNGNVSVVTAMDHKHRQRDFSLESFNGFQGFANTIMFPFISLKGTSRTTCGRASHAATS